MNRGTDQVAFDDLKSARLEDAIQQVADYYSVNALPKFGIMSQENIQKFQDSLRPTIEAVAKIGRQFTRTRIKKMVKRVVQWRLGLDELGNRRSRNLDRIIYRAHHRLRHVLFVGTETLRRALACVPKTVATFVHQVYSSNSLMLTGPPLLSTGLPIKHLVTTWGREA
jgi:hypothetical protein